MEIKNIHDHADCSEAHTNAKIAALKKKGINCLKFNGKAQLTLKTYD